MHHVEYIVSSNLPENTNSLNDLFQECNLGRPVDPRLAGVFAVTATWNGSLVGGIFVAPPGDVSRALRGAGWNSPDAIRVTLSLPSVQAIAVRRGDRLNGVGSKLLAKGGLHARQAHGSDFLLARLDANEDELHEWYRQRGFTVCGSDETIAVQGVPVPASSQYRDAWWPLTDHPAVGVHSIQRPLH